MRNFQDTFEISKCSLSVLFSICMTVPLRRNYINNNNENSHNNNNNELVYCAVNSFMTKIRII